VRLVSRGLSDTATDAGWGVVSLGLRVRSCIPCWRGEVVVVGDICLLSVSESSSDLGFINVLTLIDA
jgi:hypothetical protein